MGKKRSADLQEGDKKLQLGKESLGEKMSWSLSIYRITPHYHRLVSSRDAKSMEAKIYLRADLSISESKGRRSSGHRKKLVLGDPSFKRNNGYGPKRVLETMRSCMGKLSFNVHLKNGPLRNKTYKIPLCHIKLCIQNLLTAYFGPLS